VAARDDAGGKFFRAVMAPFLRQELTPTFTFMCPAFQYSGTTGSTCFWAFRIH
jgi:hypothetical protein